MHDTWVSLELDPGGCDNRPELLCRKRPKPYRNHGVQLPMALKDGQVLGTAIGCLGKCPVQRQPAAQCHNASQRVGAGEGRVEGQGPTLEGREDEKS